MRHVNVRTSARSVAALVAVLALLGLATVGGAAQRGGDNSLVSWTG